MTYEEWATMVGYDGTTSAEWDAMVELALEREEFSIQDDLDDQATGEDGEGPWWDDDDE